VVSQTAPKFRVELGTYGVVVEAPTKEECIALLNEATKIPVKQRIDEAIR
jgi:hypothetical protein